MKKAILFGLVVSATGWGANIVENLPAGGKYIFETKWDKYTINCTAQPLTPTVVSKTCTCTQYDQQPHLKDFRYRLSLSTLLSDGNVAVQILADGNDLKTIADCEDQKNNKYSSVCK